MSVLIIRDTALAEVKRNAEGDIQVRLGRAGAVMQGERRNSPPRFCMRISLSERAGR